MYVLIQKMIKTKIVFQVQRYGYSSHNLKDNKYTLSECAEVLAAV